MRKILPGDLEIPLRRQVPLGLNPDRDRRRPLWVHGDPSVLRLPAIGIVGTRQPSAHGLASARAIAAVCVAEGWVVVSGVARGIDEAAHEAALSAGGRTIGVLPSPAPGGLRKGARRLGGQMVGSGALISDRPPGTPPAAWSFVARNSLLAALTDGLIVVEAPEGSGALITAEAASEFGLPLAFVTAPYGAKSAVGGLSWLAQALQPTFLPPDVPPPQLLADDQGLRAWLRVCAASLREDTIVRTPQDKPPRAAPPPDGLRGQILLALGRAGAAGLTEGDLLGVSEGVEDSLPSALTLLALQGLAEQRGGRWRVCEEAVLRSRA
jgi:DNA protecting protein DprA